MDTLQRGTMVIIKTSETTEQMRQEGQVRIETEIMATVEQEETSLLLSSVELPICKILTLVRHYKISNNHMVVYRKSNKQSNSGRRYKENTSL